MVQYAVLYPPGGAFNKLRCRQVFLGDLLKDIFHDFCELSRSENKQSFVKQRVFDPLKANGYVFMIFVGDHPERGMLVQPNEDKAFEKVVQKLRSMKKVLFGQIARNEKRLEKEVCQKLTSTKKMRFAGPTAEQAMRKAERYENIVLQEGTSNTGFASDQNLFRSTLPAALDALKRIDLMLPPASPSGHN